MVPMMGLVGVIFGSLWVAVSRAGRADRCGSGTPQERAADSLTA
jgi:hypothetical protein